jgi:hypothetical protein
MDTSSADTNRAGVKRSETTGYFATVCNAVQLDGTWVDSVTLKVGRTRYFLKAFSVIPLEKAGLDQQTPQIATARDLSFFVDLSLFVRCQIVARKPDAANHHRPDIGDYMVLVQRFDIDVCYHILYVSIFTRVTIRFE